MQYQFLGAASGWGAQQKECEQGPEILKKEKILESLRKKNHSINDFKILYPLKKTAQGNIPPSDILPLIYDFNLRLEKEIEATLQANRFPIILGGDHSVAVGTWNGVYQFFNKNHKLPLGLIWIDAHLDAHTPQTSPSGAWHGMPLAGLLGYGDPCLSMLTQKNPIIAPENLCLIGSRSFEKEELQLLENLKVRIYFQDEVERRGIGSILKEAITYISTQTQIFGVSLDLDVICPKDAPGVGSPEPGGIFAQDLIKALCQLKDHTQFKAFELVEYNPKKNHHPQTANLCLDILSQIMQNG